VGKPTDFDEELMFNLLAAGDLNKKEIAGVLGCSVATLNAKLEQLRADETALMAYDKVHYLDLIQVKQRIIANVTDDKLQEAPLGQLAQAYSVFDKAQALVEGRPTEIHGLMGYLLHIEKEDMQQAAEEAAQCEAIDVTPVKSPDVILRELSKDIPKEVKMPPPQIQYELGL
jgi:hypothetical protein